MRQFRSCNSFWYLYFVQEPPLNTKNIIVSFKSTSECHIEYYSKILHKIKQHKLFSLCNTSNTFWRGPPPAPIQLLGLGCLRYLGIGWVFENSEEAVVILGETCQKISIIFGLKIVIFL